MRRLGDFTKKSSPHPQIPAKKEKSISWIVTIIGLTHPLKFFSGERTLSGIMCRNNRLWTDFEKQYDSSFLKVREYPEYRKSLVQIVDILEAVSEMAELFK